MPRPVSHQPGIRDLADRLSLSVGTVSKALNGYAGVGKQTRQRVLEAADQLGYVPNRQAQTLRQKRSRCIGLLLPTMANPVYAERMQGIYQTAAEHGYEVLVSSSEWSVAREARACRDLMGRRVEAMIYVGPADRNSLGHLQILLDAGVRVVQVGGRKPLLPGAGWIGINKREAMTRMMRHLLALGHRRPLLVGRGWQEAELPSIGWLGVQDALREAGLPEDDGRYVPTRRDPTGMKRVYEAVLDLFSRQPQAATVVMGSNDQAAMAAIAALSRLNIKVPDDVSVTGSDNILVSQFCQPPLTTISQTHLQIGSRAIEMAVAMLTGACATDAAMSLTPELIVRQSTAVCSTCSLSA